ncbi:NAD(P)H-dependent oxidoreductase [Propionicimonas sp.]|uniref:NAD(P)H-dependent oxidoreductase n=1 Tax=Propionicimonas sp. TaxID=1955623 RepID=UPI0017BAF6D5|nr:NAD(P)H-dependent oxidoreductase [Propionicimonas sp.]MBU3976388.1 NAD(P)H-dependent oxidoreductase [Actinomycetota bacterium]MBA3022019.1 NAD(P)H-dependent oxidoreductase [Propionicimonas sp.]MBU3987545.1 NAD(P)H-dependent oxidoreductase [Actinomycetota bacterium]MBU4006510.1 NAD(P)H-dependent oxidoreductase [Actinomycetota bacterium]MBU4065115.1 NAD(P)H-dependent oxidoreductase [Actinomycetota bacterium]
MSPRRILVVVGHPIAGSLNHELARSYASAAEAAGGEVRVRDLAEEPPAYPVSREQLRAHVTELGHLEVGVAEDIADLRWAEHVVIFFPQWWGTYPAVLKNWIDRTFLSGVVFRYGAGLRWEKLLSGRTARLVMTHDSPGFYNLLAYHDAAIVSLRAATLGYCGIKTVGVTRFNPVRGSVATAREKWLSRVAGLGSADGRVPGRARAAVQQPVAVS